MRLSIAPAIVAASCSLALLSVSAPANALSHPIDRFFIIMMENHSYDEVIGRTDAAGINLLTPFLTNLSQTQGNALNAYGVIQPSLGNYISLLAGNSYGIHDDNDSCYAVPPVHPCHKFGGTNLIDEIEASGRTWGDYNQSMPSVGFLGEQYPRQGDGLYRMKHNPFVYFTDIVKNPARLKKVKTFNELATDLDQGSKSPDFVFITPDECHDMHGSSPFCPKFDRVTAAGDAAANYLVNLITTSTAWTPNSVIFIDWDEGDFSNQGCCDSGMPGGGHVPLIVISARPGSGRLSAVAYNHYSVLATIEDAWGLPLLGYTADTTNVKPMFDLIR